MKGTLFSLVYLGYSTFPFAVLKNMESQDLCKQCYFYIRWINNFVMQGGHIIFFQSLSLLGYCLFPLDIGAFICMLKDNVILKVVVVCVALAWSSWAAYPFMSTAVNPRRKALALYPVVLMYVSVGFLIIAID